MRNRHAPIAAALAGALIALTGAVGAGSVAAEPGASASGERTGSHRAILLGLRSDQRGLRRFARRVSQPSSPRYGRYLGPRRLRSRFGASRRVRRKVTEFLGSQPGVQSIELSSTGTVALVVAEQSAAAALFCATGLRPPGEAVCLPSQLKGAVRQVTAGEEYTPGPASRRPSRGATAAARTGTPKGCSDGVNAGSFTPNQLTKAYGTRGLNHRGYEGQGMRVVVLSSAFVDESAFGTWAQCFGLPTPRFEQLALPGGTLDTSTEPDETYLDVETLATVAPKLRRITALFVPLDLDFTNSFPLFLFGTLDKGRLGGHLPDVLSISDGVCESLFTPAELRLSERMLEAGAAMGITALAASGDLGFLGCNTGESGASFPASSRWVTGVGGTQLTLNQDNSIADEAVWSTFAAEPSTGGGSGGGPSIVFGRPGFQRAPGIRGSLQPRGTTRLTPDIASMGSFDPGIVTYGGGQGWTGGGGTSAATPLTAALIALVNQKELAAGRPELGAVNRLLYRLARGGATGSAFRDILKGTNSPQPNTPLGRSPAGGAAQRGYDLSTGLGSPIGSGFAAAVAKAR